MNPGTDWMEQGRRLLDALRAGVTDAAPADGEHASDCRWCPLCQAAAVVRGERPEVSAALADILATAAAALRQFAGEAATDTAATDTAAKAPDPAEPEAPGAAAHAHEVQRIELS